MCANFTKIITVAIEPKMFTEIKKLTDREERSVGEWIRSAIEVSLSVFDTEYNEYTRKSLKGKDIQ